jgi:DNA-nicking Smr family endonuclease
MVRNRPGRPTEAQLRAREAAGRDPWQDLNPLMTEYVEFVDPHEILMFKRDGVQEGVYRKLRLGKYEIEAVLDLHRHTIAEARQELYEFVLQAVRLGLRTVMVLHGKGLESQPQAILKSYTAKWLRELPQVMAYHSAPRHQGGAGALFVLLRKSEQQRLANAERWRKGRPA